MEAKRRCRKLWSGLKALVKMGSKERLFKTCQEKKEKKPSKRRPKEFLFYINSLMKVKRVEVKV